MAKEISNLITFNTYKFERGGLLVDMFNQFNARVGDQGTELAIQWETSKTETKINLKERGLHFFGTGSVGQYLEKLEDGTGFKMSADASTVEWEDKDEAGSLDDGITVVKLPKQFFPQKGIFFGYFGLKDRQGNIFTSVNVWFRVLGGVPTMGAAIPYFVTEFDEVLERCNGKIVDALAELREKYQAEVKKNEDMSAETRAALSKLADAVGAVQAQITAGNVVTLKQHNDDLKKVSDKIDNRLDKMTPDPESFADLDAIKAKYPTGKDGIFVLDNGRRAVYRNGQWIDGGVYQAVGIKDGSVGSKQVSTISASKIIDNQLSPSEAEGQGNINVVGNNEYVMIVSNEVQTAANLVGTFIPLTITNKGTLILTSNITSSLDTGYLQPIYLADKNKTVLRQLGNVNVPDKNSAINAKESLKITEDPGNYYLLITSKAVGTVTYRKLTVNVSGSPASTVVEEIGDLAAKIDKSPTVTTRAFDTIVHNDVQLDKVSATDGIELTRDVNTITAKVNKANAAGDLQAIFFPVHVQNRNAAFTGTVKVAPIKFPETYTQQIYLADAERNLGELLGTFPVNSQTSADFKVNLPASQDFCIALIASVTSTFEFELTVNNSTGRNINLEEYTTWLDSGTYDHAHMDISRIDYSNMTAKTIDGVEYVSPYHTFGVDNGRLNAIYVWTEKAGTYSFCVGKLDQNNLIVDGKYFDLELAKGFNSIGVNIRTDAASNLFMKITDGVSLYEGNQAIKVQTSGQHIDLGMYSGDYFQDNHGFLPFGYDVTSLSPTDRIKDVEEQQRQNTASITQLKGATVLTANNGIKYKLVVANDGTLSTKNMTPNKVRVFGNSLTATSEGFGLAASDPQHDYYYLMSQYILNKNSKADIQRHGTGSWEWSTNSSDRQKAFDDSFKPYLDADTDLVIVQCMENVGTIAAKQTLAQDSIILLQNIKKCSPNAQIIWMYGWWGDHTVFDPAQNACDKVGAKGINLNDIGTQKSMQSYAGQKRTLKDGTVREIKDIEASHPGDAGMQAIADRLIANFDF
ncbi:hypothetical protein DN432_07030 [Lactobacillus reuteri]|uniref:hypothetical protein n=1 Tax=Limosilactobacillus reuteri TaxID=1598 RepID=UPI00128C668A|nr:hypothetical protein [Limosilactobacillus reuteri]MQB93535.1 hypothetical protein [Limosilactobacillus reuteri]